ncbi:MAG: hypothetical protein E7617_01215 [Ruminococcaceae bacterium]|nr:hypothetical protein [Oscillospiraceae bacterium]
MSEINLLSADKEQKKKNTASAVILALVMLFNPNINLYDFLPDFIGYIILAKLFERAADSTPYFEEARAAFMKLAYISIAKIPAIVIVTTTRMGNVQDHDIVALMTLVFATIEIIFLIPAVKNSFDALSYLGQRTDAESLIKSGTLISTDALRTFTFVFLIFKSAVYALPEMLRITRSVEIGSTEAIMYGSRYYPWAILASLIIGFTCGVIWLSRMTKYVKAIRDEGKFFSAIDSMITPDSRDAYNERLKKRSISRAFVVFNICAVLSFDLIFQNYNSVDLLPGFLQGLAFTTALVLLSHHVNGAEELRRYSLICGTLFSLFSLVNYVFTVKFLNEYGYSSLLYANNIAAHESYKMVEILSIVETASYLALIAICFLMLKKYILEVFTARAHTELDKKDPYLKDAYRKTVIITGLSSLLGIVKLLNVFANGNVQLIFTDSSDVTMPTIVTSSLPWLGTLITLLSIAYTLYSVYYFNYIKNDM